MSARIEQMAACLQILQPVSLVILDESQRHVGHAGAQAGGGHYRIRIGAPAFEGKNTMACHRMIYSALADMMKADIHALSIEVLAAN